METKLFEVHDRKTFLPVISVRLTAMNEAERYLIAMTGYGLQQETQSQYILMGCLRDGHMECVPMKQPGYPQVRTLWMAHLHIMKHWHELESGDVLDIEFILGETTEKKISQRLESFPNVIKNILDREY